VPQKPIQVPLWLALNLRKMNKCTLLPPYWLDIEFLKSKLEEETKDNDYSKLPDYFFEISVLLINKYTIHLVLRMMLKIVNRLVQ
jgi:GINS complex subunit 2